MNIVGQIIATLLSLLSQEQGEQILDSLFDTIEDKIAASPNKWDDKLILPLINKAREILDVPDGDD